MYLYENRNRFTKDLNKFNQCVASGIIIQDSFIICTGNTQCSWNITMTLVACSVIFQLERCSLLMRKEIYFWISYPNFIHRPITAFFIDMPHSETGVNRSPRHQLRLDADWMHRYTREIFVLRTSYLETSFKPDFPYNLMDGEIFQKYGIFFSRDSKSVSSVVYYYWFLDINVKTHRFNT